MYGCLILVHQSTVYKYYIFYLDFYNWVVDWYIIQLVLVLD